MSALMEEKEALGKLTATREKLKGLFEKKSADGRLDWKPEDHEAHAELQKQVKEEKAAFDKWHAVAEDYRQNNRELDELKRPLSPAPIGSPRQDQPDKAAERKSIGELAIESPSYKRFLESSQSGYARLDLADYGVNDFQAKTLMTTTAGYAPFVTRGSDIVPYALRRAMIQDLMPSFPIREKGVEYMEETTVTRNAAPVAEGATKPESARAFTARTANAEVIATTLPVTEQQLDDAPFLMAYINETLGEEIKLAEEDALLTGNGTPPQIQGFLTKTGVLTEAKGSNPVITAVMNAITQVQVTGFADPSALVAHPNDWRDIVTLQDTTGRYIFGDPSQISGIRGLWGITPVITQAITEGTMFTGDFRRYSYIIRRMGLRIDIGLVNDQFLKNAKTIRAETRMGLVIRRATAFCKITGV